MIINNNKDLIYNIDCLVCIPKEYEHHADIYEHNFKYVYILETNYRETMSFIDFVNKNNIREVILIDYRLEYEMITEQLSSTIKISTIITFDLASLTTEYAITVHDAVVNLYENKKISKIGLLDKNLYLLFKTKFEQSYYICLDVPKTKQKDIKKKGIAILSDANDAKHSYYNSLSAIKLLKETSNLLNPIDLVKNFNKEFKIKAQDYKTIQDLIQASEVVLYVNFCNSDNTIFIKCMDMGVPCILGNNTLLKGTPLQKLLQVNSDDDINEIAAKIQEVKNNKEIILKEYQTYRKEYSDKCKNSIEKFVSTNIEIPKENEYEKLLTIGIPVYNVEAYIAKCIDSVLRFNDKDVEILIVNDGSTDRSEEVVLKYQQKYPNRIRYIKQENHGLGNVRNVILENAKGKYIASIDSDDVINKNFFEEAWKSLKNDVDMVICDWLSIFNNKEKFPTPALDNNLQFENNYKKILYSTIMPSACNKIVKKDLYKRIGLRFIEGLKFEDLGTNPIVLNQVQTIRYINKPYYEYTIRQNSIMRTKVEYNMIDVLKLLEERINQYITKPFNKKEFMAYVFFWRVEESIINQLYELETEARRKMIDYMYENIFPVLEQLYFDNEYVSMMIERIDNKTKEYILERNKEILNKNLEAYLDKKIEEKSYKILTPALILYNYDNRS